MSNVKTWKTLDKPAKNLHNTTERCKFENKVVPFPQVILRTVGITARNIPTLCSKKYDDRRRIMPLNAYALDFYKHGSLRAMAQDNG